MWIAAFLVGFTGSLHCVGMCGPLAMLVPGKGHTGLWVNRMLYHAGRTFTYVAMGMAAGMMGTVFEIGGWQNVFSILAGILVLAVLMVPEIHQFVSPGVVRFIAWIKKSIASHMHRTGALAAFSFGAINGLLPCGLVYMALVMAAMQGEVNRSILFMAWFALGTVPLLLAATYSVQFLHKWIPYSIAKWKTALLVLIAVLMIGRGLPDHWIPIHAGHEGITVCR